MKKLQVLAVGLALALCASSVSCKQEQLATEGRSRRWPAASRSGRGGHGSAT